MTTPAAAIVAASVAAPLAVQDEPGTAGPLGLLVLLILLLAAVLLYRSMSKHIKRVPPSFDGDDQPPGRPEPRSRPPRDTP